MVLLPLLAAVFFIPLAGKAAPNIDSLYKVISGSWNLTLQCNGLTGQCTDAPPGMVQVIERIENTDSITCTIYDNGTIHSILKYKMVYDYSQIFREGRYMLKSGPFSFLVNVDGDRLSVSLHAADGGGEIFSRIITGTASERFSAAQFSLQPNPARDHFTIPDIENFEGLKVLNSSGEEILHESSKPAGGRFDLSGVSPGMYYVLVYAQGKVMSKKLIVE